MLSIDTISNNKEETLIGLKKRGFKDLKIIDKIIDLNLFRKKIQQELEDIKNELKDTNLYLENFERYQEITSKMEALNSDLNTKENRWFELIKMEEDLVSN